MNLKQLKVSKQKFEFLTSVLEYAKKEYEDILNELDTNNLQEIVLEIINKHRVDNNLLIINMDSDGNNYISELYARDINFRKYENVEDFEKKWYFKGFPWSPVKTLDDLYYVNNYDLYYKYLNDKKEEEKQKSIKKIDEQINKRNELLEKTKKFGLELPDENLIKQLELIEKIKSNDTSLEDSLKAFKLLTEKTYPSLEDDY
jgi:hypothetical protein